MIDPPATAGGTDPVQQGEKLMRGGLVGVIVAVVIAVCVFIWLQKRKSL